MSAWTEAESTREEASSTRGHVASLAEEAQQRWLEPGRAIHWRDQRRSRVVEATSRAGVLGGQLAEASGRPAEPSARAGFLEEILTAMAQARC